MKDEQLIQAVKDAIHEELAGIGLDAKTHAEHHEFIALLRDNITTARKTFIGVIVKTFTLFVLGAVSCFLWPKK